MSTFLRLSIIWLMGTISFATAQERYPKAQEGDYLIKNFVFVNGQSIDSLRLHYYMLGTPKKGKDGKVNNAVLITHGTTGSGTQFLNDRFAGALFAPGGLLDVNKYCVILTDAIGHGKSSKPSNRLRMNFPQYDYDDMVIAQYKLLTEKLGIDHIRLVMGTSMGGMHTWVWGYMFPDFMDALMPLASLPVAIAGRNRLQRKMAIDLIKMDPAWKQGNYEQTPVLGMSGAISSLIFMTSSPLQMQKQAPTREQAEVLLDNTRKRYLSSLDANDFIYAFDASRNYDPSPHLHKIKAPLVAINSADDQVNPPELGIMEQEIKKVKNGQYILLPITNETSGHGTHSNPAIWGQHLKALLERINAKNPL